MVIRLDVPRRYWNDVQMAAVVLGLDMAPDQPVPNENETTVVEISGSLVKLQQAVNRTSKHVALLGVFDRRPNGLR